MFNPFFTTKPQGSGLGLAIVRKIVDAHEGRIDVTSLPNRGTTFRVTLPVAYTNSWVR
jgi:signal transduction histidine kinase